jgi:creatinine amidohydrolase
MQLLDLPHADARAALRTGTPVYLLINPVEYHGPHLSLRNDFHVSEGLVRDLHARLAAAHPEWPLLQCAPLELGVEPAPGPGSRHTPFKLVRAAIRETCRALAELGARRVVLMTFHGAPLHSWALEAGVLLLAARGVQAFSPLNLVLEELLSVDGARFAPAYAHVEDAREREEMMRELHLDFHAGFFETSMALHYAPQTVSPLHRDLPPCPAIRPDAKLARAARAARALGRVRLAAELELAAAGMGWTALRPFPGYTGRPHRATAQAGAVFAKAISDRYAERAEEIFAGRARSPQPAFGWLRAVSFGGRVMPAPVPVEDVRALPA